MQMTRYWLVASVLLFMVSLVGFAFQSPTGNLTVKPGEEYYVCGCTGCGCETISTKAGKCGCGQDLVKATVTKVDGDTAYFKADGWDKDRAFHTTGKYACACGPSCGCKTISQKPGKCSCGHDLAKVS
jgi:hypothetical protein